MKKLSVFLMGLFLLTSIVFGAYEIYQNSGEYYGVNVSSNTQVVLSTSTATLIPSVSFGVSRRFKVIGEPTGNPFFTLETSSSNVVANGCDLEPHTYYVESDYFGNMYFQATISSSTLSVQYLKRQN